MVSASRENHRLRVSDSRVLRRVFERNGDRKNVHKVRPRDYYSYPNNIQVIRSRKMKWNGHAARRREKKMHTCFCGETCMGTD